MMSDKSPDEKPKILVVDDTPTNLSLLEEILEGDYSISIAQSGTQALSITEKFQPDLILLDVNMPGMDGFETCQKLKSREATRNIPVIFITARTEPEDVIQGFSEGGVDYITKPFNYSEVVARVQTHIKNQQLIRELESSNEQLKELNQLKNKFLGMASHDMRNSLSAIKGYSQILKEDIDQLPGVTKDRFLNFIFKSSDNMFKMVNELLRERFRERLCFIVAWREGEPIAGTFNVQKGEVLYGRYWGADYDLRHLHFNVCYYAAIEHCIEQGLARFEPGAGGDYKQLRGFDASPTFSMHFVADPRLRRAIQDFLARERSFSGQFRLQYEHAKCEFALDGSGAHSGAAELQNTALSHEIVENRR